MSRRETKNGKQLPENKQVFRYWVEIREHANGSVRNLPLNGVNKIHIPRSKKEPQKPNEEVLQLKDGTATFEAKNLEDLAAQLRARYPDDAYERRLHWERDRSAELRRAEAITTLSEILLPRAYLEALYVIQAELERAGPNPEVPETVLERAAAARGIALIDYGEWKQRDTWVHFPSSWIRQILERFASGETSLLDECAPTQRRKRKALRSPYANP